MDQLSIGPAIGPPPILASAPAIADASANPVPLEACGTRSLLKKEMLRMHDRCVRLGALVARVGYDEKKGGQEEQEEHAILAADKVRASETSMNPNPMMTACRK